jgi:hypothetical protein
VVAVRHEQGVAALDRPVLQLELPAAAVAPARVLDLRLEADPVAEAEVVDVGGEVRGDLRVVRVVRIGLRHRVVRVLHPVPRRVDVQLAVRRRHPVAVAEDPVAADAVGRLEDRERDVVLVERLRGGDAGRAGADDGGGRVGRHARQRTDRDDAGVRFAV